MAASTQRPQVVDRIRSAVVLREDMVNVGSGLATVATVGLTGQYLSADGLPCCTVATRCSGRPTVTAGGRQTPAPGTAVHTSHVKGRAPRLLVIGALSTISLFPVIGAPLLFCPGPSPQICRSTLAVASVIHEDTETDIASTVEKTADMARSMVVVDMDVTPEWLRADRAVATLTYLHGQVCGASEPIA